MVLGEFIETGLVHDTNFYFTNEKIFEKKIKKIPYLLKTNFFEYKKAIFCHQDTMNLLFNENLSHSSNNPVHDRISSILQELSFCLQPNNQR